VNRIRTEILEPVKVRSAAGLEDDDEYVDERYREVERALQSGVKRLARKRRFPIFG
jgi:hypothetical protein